MGCNWGDERWRVGVGGGGGGGATTRSIDQIQIWTMEIGLDNGVVGDLKNDIDRNDGGALGSVEWEKKDN